MGSNQGCSEFKGMLNCWGGNPLNSGGNYGPLTPKPVNIGIVKDVSAGGGSTCATTQEGNLYCWRDQVQPNPTLVLGLGHVISVSVGERHTCAINLEGNLYCWGWNAFGQLGLGNEEDQLTPQLINLRDVTSVSAGRAHTCAITRGDRLYCWGMNLDGELGLGNTGEEIFQSMPEAVNLLDVISVSAGEGHTCAITRDSKLYCWGENLWGELGLGNSGSNKFRVLPEAVNLSHVTSVSTGHGQTCATTQDGTLYCWGNNMNGQLGLGDLVNRKRPIPLNLKDVTAVSAGYFNTCAMTRDNQVSCWGSGGFGRLGDGRDESSKQVSLPQFVGRYVPEKILSFLTNRSLGILQTLKFKFVTESVEHRENSRKRKRPNEEPASNLD